MWEELWKRCEGGIAFLAVMRTRVCQSMCGKGPVLIWPSGKTGEEEGGEKGGMTEEERSGIRGEEGGLEERREEDVMCTTAALWRVGLTLSQRTSGAQIRAPLIARLQIHTSVEQMESDVRWRVQGLLYFLIPL